MTEIENIIRFDNENVNQRLAESVNPYAQRFSGALHRERSKSAFSGWFYFCVRNNCQGVFEKVNAPVQRLF